MRYSNGVRIAARCVFLFLFAAAVSSAWVQTAAAVPGDVDASGVINQVDAALIKDHLLQRAPLTGDRLARADANQDGSLDLEDVVWVANHPTPPQLAPNVFVVDSIAGLEALDWTPPTLLLRWSGAGAHGIDPGDYVVGSAFNGFLCRVASITENASILTIQTTQATLANILLQGQSTGQLVRLGPPRLASSAVRAAGLSRASATWDRVEWNLSGKVLY